ncbi:sn-glycerol-3-phosphate ABC transporter ATP-binding protein UgpC [Photobacterium sp. BZF1]|uniref:ABC transporter ATP-binding protein n=1 Tax=Photobacterium sp. BZF1 TaxID=1904457 RepID=UPI0016537590|nr:sn-glycerol-3-phosphate ABC transporter ATP-binding protein UgpC [Photobacterium sp. BZF1]MBC7005697.1 sn-glycerol-3-phosphate ABC transporter ATP-binding protein UgpC [Photobacterium sp. BZF1]
MASVEFKHIDKIYPGNVHIVKDFNLRIEDGEFIVFLGPSGCGKSTTLRMLAGLEDISGGEIMIGDKVVNDLEPKDRDIAMVFQSYALYPHMTVYENIAFALKLSGFDKKEIEQKVRPVADMLQLTPLLERKPKALSGGQRQRVAMGRAMVRTPEVFLFDEPLSNLDAKLRNSMRSEIKAMHKKLNKTTIYVTHDQVEAMTLADRIVILRDGKVEQVGTPYEIYHNPANKFVAGFIGSPTMNLLPVSLEQGQGWKLDLQGQEIPLVGEVEGNIELGQHVVMGIRPSDIHLTPATLSVPVEVKGLVVQSELLGSTVQLTCQIGDYQLVVEAASTELIEEGVERSLYLDSSQLHLFDDESGRSIYTATAIDKVDSTPQTVALA